MQSLLLPHSSFPDHQFRERRFNTDPGRLSLNLSWSNNACGSSPRAPYPSPPMSGSPPAENPSELPRGDRRRRRSEPHLVTTNGVLGSIPAPSSSSAIGGREGPPEGSAQIHGGLSERWDMIHDPLPSSRPPAFVGGLSAPAETAYLQPATATLPPATTARPLPRRTARRTKAHVASACVNCKRKHLGCDAARPCRRCVVAGKAATCVDVTHKKRGRPPLKAEETPLRPYAAPFEDPSASRDSLHISASSRSHFHRRTSSREIRPITDLQFPQSGDATGRIGSSGLGPAVIQPQRWPPSVFPSPQALTTSPSLPSGLGQRPFSAESSRHSIATQPPSPFIHSTGGALPAVSSSRSPARASGPMPSPFSHSLPPATSPRQYPQPYPPTLSPYLERPRTPNRPPVSETPASTESRGPYVESALRLPPILPSSARDPGPIPPGHRRSDPYPTPWSFSGWPEQRQERQPQQSSLEVMEPVSQPQFYRPLSGPAYHEFPPRQPGPSMPAVQTYPPQQSPPRTEAEQPRTAGDSGDGERPAKRRRMALDDIVND